MISELTRISNIFINCDAMPSDYDYCDNDFARVIPQAVKV